MNYFEILKIPPTKNVKDIRKAYSALLKIYHPEESPEEFQRIHDAYQKALTYAKSVDTEYDNFLDDQKEQSLFNSRTYDDLETMPEVRQFDEIENFDKKYTNKENEIQQLLNMFKSQKREYGSPQSTIFKEPLFLKYYQDASFIQEYTKLVHQGLYNYINLLEKKKLEKIHDHFFFASYQSQKMNESLYKELYDYLYKRDFSVSKILFCTLLTFVLFPMYKETGVLVLTLALLGLYSIFQADRDNPKHKSLYQKGRYAIMITYALLFIFGAVNIHLTEDVESQSFGEYQAYKESDGGYQMYKQIDNQFALLSHPNSETHITKGDILYKIRSSIVDILDFGFYKDELYYIQGTRVYMQDKETPLWNFLRMRTFKSLMIKSYVC